MTTGQRATKATAGKKVAAKKAAVSRAKVAGTARRKAEAEAKATTGASQWKQRSVGGFPLEVPSGNVALVRAVGMQAFLDRGIIPNGLREIAMEAIQKKKSPEIKFEDLTEEQIKEMIDLFDTVTVYCVLEPAVQAVPLEEITREPDKDHAEPWLQKVPVPIGDERREEDVLYVDEVDMEDKAFVFQFACGGTRDVESFREEYELRVERISREQNLENEAE